MASALSSRCLGANILQLPPSIRTAVYANARSFSSTPQRKIDTANLTQLAVAAPTAVLDGIHSLGVPWCAAIPITAVLVRGVFGYYLAVRPARRSADTRSLLYPITHARVMARVHRAQQKTREDWKKANFKPSSQSFVKSHKRWQFLWNSFLETNKVSKAFGMPRFSWHNWFNFAMLIAFAEAVRIKCGTREGLLSLVLGPVIPASKDTPSDPAEALAERLESQLSKQEQLLNTEGLPDGNALAQEVHLAPQKLNLSSYADLMDPTLKVEGFSWLQDLTIPDSTMTLPLALAFFMAANAVFRPSVKKEDDRVKDVQEKLRNLDQEHKDAKKQPELKRPRQPEPVKTTTATNDVLHAMEVAEKMRLDAQDKKKWNNPIVALPTRKKVSLVFAGMFFFIGLQLPAALTLYMAAALGTAWLQGRWLDVKYPVREPIRPCRRPMRVKVRQEYGET